MKTLVIVITYPEAWPILQLNWPWLRRSECDIAVVNHAGQPFFPLDPHPRFNLSIGGPPQSTDNKWVDRFLDILQWATTHPDCDPYERYVLTEADSVFLGPIPDTGEFAGTMAGYRSPGFNGEMFYHAPWCLTYEAATEFLRRARIMLSYKISEHGFIDRFIGAYRDLYGVYIGDLRGQTYTRNTVDLKDVEECRAAIKRGVWFIHGIKSPDVLRAITEGL
jgi:hypothetical protein